MGGGQSKKDNKFNGPSYSTQLPLIPVQLQQQQQQYQPQQYGQYNLPYGQAMPLPQPIMNTLQPLDMSSLSGGNLVWQQPFQPPLQQQQQQPMFFQPPMASTQMQHPTYEQSMTAPQLSVPKMTCDREMNSTMSTVWMQPQHHNQQPPLLPGNSNISSMPTIPPLTQGRVRVYNYGPVPRTN